jgi:hypothetical protein
MGMACRFWFSWYRHAFRSCCLYLGTKYLTHVGNLETQKVNEVDEFSILETFLNLKLNWYLPLYFLLYPYLDGII